MLTRITLKTFKCFEALVLPLYPLTLLTGLNASGKSTVLQALAMIHQSARVSLESEHILLHGDVVALGTIGDVVDKVNGRRGFEVRVDTTDPYLKWEVESESADRGDVAVPIKQAWYGRHVINEHPRATGRAIFRNAGAQVPAQDLLNLVLRLTYLSAERAGPREVYPLLDPREHQTVGPLGDRAIGTLYWYGDQAVQDSLVRDPDDSPTLLKQSGAWLAHFFPGAGLEVRRVPGANLVSLGFRTSLDTDFHRPQNVGFGLSNVLPILVACLNARPGDLVMVENPEVHLHPRGQAEMGIFLARVAAAGVQVLVETHSDHVLNGVRRAVRSQLLSPAGVALHYFQPRGYAAERGFDQVISPSMDRDGNIDHWPEGFFDQFEKDAAWLAGWGT